jgi:signal transduction histidine kinase
VIYVARDVTEQVQIEQIRSDFVAYASHELRTPLTTIKMLVRMLLLDSSPKTQSHNYLTLVDQQVERQIRLVNNLLDFTRLEAGQYDLPLERVDPRLIVQGAVGSCRPLAEEKRIQLGMVFDGAPAWMLSNSVGLEQVLVNLVSNAVKFTPEGGSVSVLCGQVDGEVQFSVRDTGIGMTPEQLERMFVKFYTVRNPRKQGEGTGLGLAISDMIVRQLGGHIDVTSEIDVGSCFTVHLPLRTA